MMMRMTILLVTGALIAGCGVAATPRLAGQQPAASAAQARGGFVDLQGRPVSLDAFKGRPVVLSFLAPGDWDSGAQVPLLIRLAGAYKPEGIAFVCGGEGSQGALRELGRELPFDVWQDLGGRELAARGFTGVPAHQFITRDGRVQASREGFLSRGQLTELIEALR
ncbi:MAG: TlpA family protein disulfide reductase [Candidatus Sericytochromatia bacterium]|nr:TlpA family protein disulfide reductase [Candidatus Tanganyikabacteria bacterium]